MLQGGGDALSFSFDNVLPGKYKGVPSPATPHNHHLIHLGVKGHDRKVLIAFQSSVAVGEFEIFSIDANSACVSPMAFSDKVFLHSNCIPLESTFFPLMGSGNQFVISSC